jgi:hypothetical protein
MSSDDDPLRRSVRAAFNGLRNLSVHTSAVGRAILTEPASSHPLASDNEAAGHDSDADAPPPEAGRKRLGDGLRAWQQRATEGSAGEASDRSGGITSTSGRGPDQDWLYVGADTVQQRRGHALFDVRLQQFKRELELKGSVDMRNVRALAYDGVPDGEGLRPVIWKVWTRHIRLKSSVVLWFACFRILQCCSSQHPMSGYGSGHVLALGFLSAVYFA